MKAQTKTKAPIIRALNYSAETIAEVRRIQTSDCVTKRKENIRNVLKGPMCAVCAAIPDFRIEYNMTDILRIECYCNACFTNVYQKNKDININQIAEAFNCTIAEPGSGAMSKIKVEGYTETVKSTGSLADRTIICQRCRVTRIFFDETQRGYNNVLVPLEYRTLRPHDCDYSYPFFCQWCDAKDMACFNIRPKTFRKTAEYDSRQNFQNVHQIIYHVKEEQCRLLHKTL